MAEARLGAEATRWSFGQMDSALYEQAYNLPWLPQEIQGCLKVVEI